MTKKYLTPNQVADYLMVTPSSVRHWAEKGDLDALTTPGGHRRFLPKDVEHFAATRGIKLQLTDDTEDKKVRILIIDDDVQLTRYLEALFQGYPDEIIVEVAHDGFLAGLKVRQFSPNFVLLDLMMPGIDGYEVCKRLKFNDDTSNVRIIAMTGYPSDENIKKILAAGAEICMKKPLCEQDLLKHLGID